MTVRGADYKRRALDNYPTPLEVTRTLFKHVEFNNTIFDPACGKKELILVAARGVGKKAYGRDIIRGKPFDFLTYPYQLANDVDIVTNPPYGDRRASLALKFIERALELTTRNKTRVAMLLPVDFDSGKTRQHVFNHPCFAEKLVLLDRIKWFNGQAGSLNHAWYVWSRDHDGPPIIKYARIEHATHR